MKKQSAPYIKTTSGRRLSRLSEAEREALELVLPAIEITIENRARLYNALNRYPRVVLEIGFGRGDFLYSEALREPETLFIGVEVFLTGVAKLLRRMVNFENQNKPLPENILLSTEDIRVVLKEIIPDGLLDRVYVLFPDPWPKKRQKKRRLLKEEFVSLLKKKLKHGADVVVATDCSDYAEEIYHNFLSQGFICKEKDLPQVLTTKYAQKALSKGHDIYSFRFKRQE